METVNVLNDLMKTNAGSADLHNIIRCTKTLLIAAVKADY